MRISWRIGLVIATCSIFVLSLLTHITCTAASAGQDYAVTLYGGRVTNDVWTKSLTPEVEFADAYIIVGAFSWTAYRFIDGALSLELEGQIGKYFGEQDNWEINLPILAGRWSKFPWNHHVASSFAFGIGPSYATGVPPLEEVLNESSQKWLVHWFGEITVGPAKNNWSVALRLHHRSAAFGTVADHGGLNILTAGVKFRW